MNSIQDKLTALRKLMKERQIHAYIVPTGDAHQSEYPPDCWQRRQWLSGFTGSAGDAVVTLDKAGLWTDSRYYLQAEHELKGSEFILFKSGQPDVPKIEEWLKQELQEGEKAGIDPAVFSYDNVRRMRKYLKNWHIALASIESNLVDPIWQNRPAIPLALMKPHPLAFVGESLESKLSRLREKLKAEKAYAHVLTALDAIAWLFNIRGQDIEYNPVVVAYAIATMERAMLFVDFNKITDEVKRHLSGHVEVYPYDDFKRHLLALADFSELYEQSQTNGDSKMNRGKIWLDPSTVNQWIVEQLEGRERELLFRPSPVSLMKAVKNATEIEGFKATHVRDGVAMAKFLCWIQQNAPQGELTELSAARQLERFRQENERFQGLSFNTISAFNDHGAIVHYSVGAQTDCSIQAPGIYLVDSGGQYLDGATDITRTVAIGTPTDEQKDRFTRVLKGHIQLAMTRFPKGTMGKQLDTLARKPLWDIGLNYGHGTGHGVGHYLNVHERPPTIAFNRRDDAPLEPGMISSIEPGYYKAGFYGIRIENLAVVVKDETLSTENDLFYRFETLTLCPIDLKLVAKSLLTTEEIDFLNDYHRRVLTALLPHVDEKTANWLKEATQPIA
jgi:Xaa-Pro aminopeptidase